VTVVTLLNVAVVPAVVCEFVATATSVMTDVSTPRRQAIQPAYFVADDVDQL
jgi:hypothetical protein